MKYIAIKVSGFDYWIWFEKDKTSELNGLFVGIEGWGEARCFNRN